MLYKTKITFCMACRNRTEYLKNTIFDNLDVAFNRDCDFTLVNYGSEDDLDEFVRSELINQVRSGIIKYYHYDADSWHASKAKNVSHSIASGDLLFNLDCDNFINITLYDSIIKFFGENSNLCLFNASTPGAGFKIGNNQYAGNGTGGRICMPREMFMQIGGYDETFEEMGNQDNDLMYRVMANGAKFLMFKENCEAILHKKCLGMSMDYDEWVQMDTRNKKISEENIAAGRLVANTNFNKIRREIRRIFL